MSADLDDVRGSSVSDGNGRNTDEYICEQAGD